MAENIRELLKAHRKLEREVYLDNENSSMVPAEVVDAMLPYFNEKAYGNPALTHKPGWEAFETIMQCSKQIAAFLDCETPERVTFTPGETEANNLALVGTTLSTKSVGKKIVTSEIEPLGLLHITDLLQNYGFSVEKIPVDAEGSFNLEELGEAVDRETAIVSLSMVNHEIGTIEEIKEARQIVEDRNPDTLFHTDASDAYGRVPFSVEDLEIDLATVSSYKILGPRGIGALYVRDGVKVTRILEGQVGTQNLWPGVENTPLIVGFTRASDLAFKDFRENASHMRRLRDRLVDGIVQDVTRVELNGPRGGKRAPDNVNVSFLGCEGESLTIELSLHGVYVSSGSACMRRLLQPSHVLRAIGKGFAEAHSSILMKVTRYHTSDDVEYALSAIRKAVERIRGISGSMEMN